MAFSDPTSDKEMQASLNMLVFDLQMSHLNWSREQCMREAERCVLAKRGRRRSMWMSAVSRAQIAERHRVRRTEAAARQRERIKASRDGRWKDALS